MKIAFVTTYNAQDINSWSGTPYFMSKSFIDAGVEVEFIGELNTLPEISFLSRTKKFVYNKLLRGRLGQYITYYEPSNLKYFAAQVQKKLQSSDADIVFSPGAHPIAYLNTNKPIVMWSDATFAVMLNYYSQFTNFSFSTIKNCHKYEKKLVKRLSLALFSSEWAAKSAIKHYGAKEDIVKVVPYGANIQCNRLASDIVEINKMKSLEICKLLFIGQDWERKGGESAVKIACELNNLNIKTELTVVGCIPRNESSLPDYVKIIGFVDKSKKDGNDLIEKLFCDSHFFVLPTTADCTPIVFSEANSYGLPVITINTGGVSSIIRNDVNGKMFDTGFDIKECARYIGHIYQDFDRYNNISKTSFNEYNTRLNWEVSIAKIITYCEEILKLQR